MKTLKDFWYHADENDYEFINFVDKNGNSVDDMEYPLSTEVTNEVAVNGGCVVTLNI